MARTKKLLSARLDIAHLISTGILARVCPRPLIEDVLSRHGRSGQRCRLLPGVLMVYFVMAMALWREAALEEVLRVVCEGINWLGGKVSCAGKSAISQARSRLGPEVMESLAERVLRPIATEQAPGAWYKGLRLMAVDGSCLDVADEKKNSVYFGYPGASRGEAAFPQMRVLSLIECGTHVVTAAEMGPYRRSEQEMAAALFPVKLNAQMLLMADRNFYGFTLWQQTIDTGCKLLWRVKSNLKLELEQRLPDGSYLSNVYASSDRRRSKGQQVRVIEYTLDEKSDSEATVYRLLSNILDHEFAPAVELAALYHERWEAENVFGEIKNQLYGYKTILRSKTPDLVRQEMWGLLMAHFAVRQIMFEAALKYGMDPDRLSFINAVRVLKRKLPQAMAIPP